jgi:hypothetical protein
MNEPASVSSQSGRIEHILTLIYPVLHLPMRRSIPAGEGSESPTGPQLPGTRSQRAYFPEFDYKEETTCRRRPPESSLCNPKCAAISFRQDRLREYSPTQRPQIVTVI